MFPQCSHITRKRGVYYYRRRLPAGHPEEVTFSLRTRVYRDAEWLAERLNDAFDRVIAAARDMTPEHDLAAVVRDYLKRTLDFDLQRRTSSPHKPVYNQSPDPGQSARDADLIWIDTELNGARNEFVNRLYDHQRPLIDDLMEDHGIPEEQRDALAHGILQARVEMWETIRKRTLGEFPALGITATHEAKGHRNAKTDDAPPGAKFSEVLPPFIELMKTEQGWRGQTLAQNKTTYRMFIECCGDRPVSQYVRKDLAKFYDLLRSLPALYSKSKAWSRLSLAEVVELTKGAEHERLTMKTVKRHFSALCRLFTYLKRRGEYVGENPAHDFEFPSKGRARDKRKMWQGEQLRNLFASPVWTGCANASSRSKAGTLIIKDEKYWLPILGLFHGNRLEEFAQLLRSDVRCEEGIWFLDINDELTKQLKNEQSKRRVPIHPRVKQLGFLAYVEGIAPNGGDRIFPNLKPGGADNKLGFTFTKWWTRYRQQIGLYEKGLDYHSFRGGVTTKLTAAHVSLDIRNELLGHEGTSVDEKVYQKGLPLQTLAEAIARVQWPEFTLGMQTAEFATALRAGGAKIE